MYEPLSDRLLRNDGGYFTDISEAAGIAARATKSLALGTGDLDDDGDTVLDGNDGAPLDPFLCQDLDGDTCDDCSVVQPPDTANDGCVGTGSDQAGKADRQAHHRCAAPRWRKREQFSHPSRVCQGRPNAPLANRPLP